MFGRKKDNDLELRIDRLERELDYIKRVLNVMDERTWKESVLIDLIEQAHDSTTNEYLEEILGGATKRIKAPKSEPKSKLHKKN